MQNITFMKTGREIKIAIAKRRTQLEERLAQRNETLDEFLSNPKKVRSYVIRASINEYSGHGRGVGYILYGKDDISSEERREIDQLCQRISEIEQELYRLAYITTHLDDDKTFELGFNDLIGYGFEP